MTWGLFQKFKLRPLVSSAVSSRDDAKGHKGSRRRSETMKKSLGLPSVMFTFTMMKRVVLTSCSLLALGGYVARAQVRKLLSMVLIVELS